MDLRSSCRLRAAALMLAAAILLSAAATAALAQQDGYYPRISDQTGALALRSACKGDIRRFCAREAAGGGPILRCLRAHGPAVSPVCRETAYALIAGENVPERSMPPWAALLAARDACTMDALRLCPHVVPGGGRIIRCLIAQREAVSRRCRAAMAAARDVLGY